MADRLVPVREEGRFRLALGRVAPEVGLGGLVLLDEGPEISVRTVPLVERFALLFGERAAGSAAERALDLVSVPMYRLTRPRTWAALPAVLRAVLDVAVQDTDGRRSNST